MNRRPSRPHAPGSTRGRHGSSRAIVTALASGLALAVAIAALGPAVALAQSSSASYQIPRQSIDGGAGRASSASYALHGTIGQPDAGPAMTSASYTLRGGFHLAAPAAPLPDPLFADGFEAP